MADLESKENTGDVRPRPDPTILTTEQLQREVGTLKELLQQRIDELEHRLEERFTATKEFSSMLMLERQKRTETTFDEQRRAMGVAEEEREKSARNLRGELGRQIEQGDQSLRDHIGGQVEQIRMLAESMDEQSKLRVEAVANALEQQMAQLRREHAMALQAQQDAITKAERAGEKQFDEFAKTVQAQLDGLRGAVADLTRRFDKLA